MVMPCLPVALVLGAYLVTGIEPSTFVVEPKPEEAVSLLQAEVEKAKRSGVPTQPLQEVNDRHGQSQFCQRLATTSDGSFKDLACAHVAPPASPGSTLVSKQAAPTEIVLAALDDVAPGDVPSAAPAGAGTGSTALGLLLKLLAAVLVVDVFKRWRRQDGGSCSEPAAWEDLLRASLLGDLSRCQELLDRGISCAGSDFWGCTVLHAASKGGSVSLVKKLLEHGASPHMLDSWDETPLHSAARAGHADVCELLLAYGSAIDSVNANEWTPLVVAAEAGHEAVCKLLLSRGATVAALEKSALPSILVSLFTESTADKQWEADESCGKREIGRAHV